LFASQGVAGSTVLDLSRDQFVVSEGSLKLEDLILQRAPSAQRPALKVTGTNDDVPVSSVAPSPTCLLPSRLG
jgi:hypothetical protein